MRNTRARGQVLPTVDLGGEGVRPPAARALTHRVAQRCDRQSERGGIPSELQHMLSRSQCPGAGRAAAVAGKTTRRPASGRRQIRRTRFLY